MGGSAPLPEVVVPVDELRRDAAAALRRLERGMLLEQFEDREGRVTHRAFPSVRSLARLLEHFERS